MAKRKKILSILVIPEGEKQTLSVKIRYGVLKILFVLFALFCIVLIFGAISYWERTKIVMDYERISETNRTLRENDALINEIMQDFLAYQQTHNRIRRYFGEKIEIRDSDPSSSLKDLSSSDDTNYIALRAGENLSQALTLFLRADLLSAYPTYIPVEGEITQYFSPKDAVTGIGHFGVDFSAKEGSVISAAGDGIVLFANWTVEAGNQIIIDHQNGYISLYKHNATLLVQERMFVYQGQPIALLGSSGLSSAPHLHFEIWKHYIPIDPLTLWSVN